MSIVVYYVLFGLVLIALGFLMVFFVQPNEFAKVKRDSFWMVLFGILMVAAGLFIAINSS